MKLSSELEKKVKEEIWDKLAERLGDDVNINDKEINIAGASVKIELFLDLDVEE